MGVTLALSMIVLAILDAAASHLAEWTNGAAIPITKRSGLVLRNADQTVNFNALESHVAGVQRKILRGFHNFEKNNGKTHPSATKIAVKRATESLKHYIGGYYDEEYYGIVGIGTPEHDLNVVFDTATADLIIPSTSCDSSCNGHNTWDFAKSSTARDLGEVFDVNYKNGKYASGKLVYDNVLLPYYVASEQALLSATRYSRVLQESPADGILGLGFSQISELNHASPAFQSLVSQKKVPNPVFSLKLAHSESELYVGGSNVALYTGDFSYASITTEAFWQITMDSIGPYEEPILQSIDCIIDTTTPLITGHPSDVQKLYAALGGTPAPGYLPGGYYTFPCDDFPTLYLTFGGSPFPISSSDLNLGPVSPDSTNCASAIVAQEIGATWVIGTVFLRQVYTKFDVGKARVGFAPLALYE